MNDDGLRCGCAGATVWFTGLPGSGKTTIAQALADALRERRHRVEILDGDPRYATLPTGPARDDPHRHTERTGLAAEVLARNGFLTLVSATAPGAAGRAAVRRRHEASGTPYVEIHLDAPLSVCAKRRPTGEEPGSAAPTPPPDEAYEPPPDPDLRLTTHHMSITQTAAAVYALLADKGVVRSRCPGPTEENTPHSDPLAGHGS